MADQAVVVDERVLEVGCREPEALEGHPEHGLTGRLREGRGEGACPGGADHAPDPVAAVEGGPVVVSRAEARAEAVVERRHGLAAGRRQGDVHEGAGWAREGDSVEHLHVAVIESGRVLGEVSSGVRPLPRRVRRGDGRGRLPHEGHAPHRRRAQVRESAAVRHPGQDGDGSDDHSVLGAERRPVRRADVAAGRDAHELAAGVRSTLGGVVVTGSDQQAGGAGGEHAASVATAGRGARRLAPRLWTVSECEATGEGRLTGGGSWVG